MEIFPKSSGDVPSMPPNPPRCIERTVTDMWGRVVLVEDTQSDEIMPQAWLGPGYYGCVWRSDDTVFTKRIAVFPRTSK
jgi:hypothetical protein